MKFSKNISISPTSHAVISVSAPVPEKINSLSNLLFTKYPLLLLNMANNTNVSSQRPQSFSLSTGSEQIESLLFSPRNTSMNSNIKGSLGTEDYYASLGSGFTPRAGTGFTPRAGTGFTPRSGFNLSTGFTPRSGFNLSTGFTPRAGNGFTPKGLGREMFFAGLTPKNEPVVAEPLPLPPRNENNTVVPPAFFEYLNAGQDVDGGVDHYKQAETDARRRMQNRARVTKCRKRKQDRLSYLEGRNSELEMENDQLRVKASSTGELNIHDEMNTSAKEAMMISQEVTVDRLKTAINNGLGTVEEAAQNIWLHHANMVHGGNGARSTGFNEIVKHFEAMSRVFSSYRVKNVSVARQGKSCSKAVATWDIELVLFAKPAKAARSTGPFHQLAPHLAGDKIRFTTTSYLTFKGDKIVEEVQVIDSLALLSGILTKNRRLGPHAISSITNSIANIQNSN